MKLNKMLRKQKKKEKKKERRMSYQQHQQHLFPNVTTPKKEEVKISREDHIQFWGYTSEIQYGEFKPENLTKLNTWLLFKDATWLIQKNNIGYFGIKKGAHGIPTLPESNIQSNAFFHMKYGKIPHILLKQIVAFFKEIMRQHSGAEAYAQIYWDLQEMKYVLNIPLQTVSGAAVTYDKTKDLDRLEPNRYVYVYECHSH